MTEKDEPPNTPPPEAPRRKWEAPRVQSGQLFEANSLACHKSGPTPEECVLIGPIKS